ncbi:ribosome biogenesis GTP-binding protein YihA/YsxC [Cycloclasticus pugetii]|uniref:ribosome biogenesis GTP-binding protein YihA/YsxC n=1 Tax=Cycloclasticus pugetii TaxID=34068 RepID=UPI00091857A5|nr:ribosome biogenesis GTP-binding protein YihA/YsxC [Cycloclasticus pugetii]SHJ17631.1 cell division checkpoint GTPase YihA [Cycloclasticus pugetii]|tara:strand:+ start:2168 stop:2770 length:603 start_codon:yes stop_codon:yes gene_type:complete
MNPLYHRAEYLLNAPNLKTTPKGVEYEVAFAGRSNAGKSSAINTLTNQKSLARTSKTPGRTQQLVYFKLDDQRCLVDLPGYGFAKIPPKIQQQWQTELERYLEKRQALHGLVLLVDIRRSLGEYDRQMIDYATHLNLDVFVALTKADKLNRNNAKNTLFAVQKQLKDSLGNVQVELFSSLKKEGIEQLHNWLDEHLNVQK